MRELLYHPLTQAVVAGVIAAAAVDIAAFRSWKSLDEAEAYNWKVAAWRWFQGAGLGLLTGLGLSGIQAGINSIVK